MPNVPVVLGVVPRFSGFLEPLVLVRCMIQDQVQDHFYVEFVCNFYQLVEIFLGTIERVYFRIVLNVVSSVCLGALEERAEPDCANP